MLPTRIQALWDRVRSSYWFIPSLMAVASWLLAGVMLMVETGESPAWIDAIPWLYANQADGARALLSTIAGTMITVAGVTFSITVVAVSYTAGQFGPRILTNFMRDTGNQITLGTFIGTFLYCLLLLRTVRAPGEPMTVEAARAIEEGLNGFIPHLGIAVALGMAVASVGVLIYFIHHVPESIHISNVVAEIGRELNARVGELFPGRLGDAPGEESRADPEAFRAELESDGRPVEAHGDGYIQRLDERRILDLATKKDLRIRLRYRPGNFVGEGRVLMVAGPGDRVDDEVLDRLRSHVALGRSRNSAQDVIFLAEQLVEIAVRALSPGVNDPFTATTCMDWLGAALSAAARDRPPSALRADRDGTPRILAEPVRFSDLVDRTFRDTRQYVAADRNAVLHALRVASEVGLDLDQDDDEKREELSDAVEELADAARRELSDEACEELEAHVEVARDILEGRLPPGEAHGRVRWLRGTA